MKKAYWFWLSLLLITAACTTTKNTTTDNTEDDEDMTHVFLDSMQIIAHDGIEGTEDEYPYRPSEDRAWDLQHTMLDISFDWNNQTVIGTAVLTLSPLFYTQSSLDLDAVDFTISRLLVNGKPAPYQYDQKEISIVFAQPVTRRDKVTLTIDYVAKPRPETNDAGAAISSDQGLFFIDPLDTIPGLPRQIWTQGETSNNRRWFPTLDQPNERGTQEIIMTVADTLMTLSNGSLISSTSLPDGMRRDHWKLELPHAPYLAMVAVGQWDKVSDSWRGRPVDYYVDPGYGPDARAIFAHTPEMIEFFSQKLGFDFVWPKYAQVIVKNFVSGAMENTTAVVFGDFIQFHADDVLEEGVNDYIVSHELFHHWFGDLVTCESWANLTLNEGFANYAEYLWTEYKYGRPKADVIRINELSGYFDQASYDAHPLIHYHYSDENAMFDAHSYNKGGLVLHMLRDIVGDEAFFASLRLYLQRHAYAAAEVHDLRQAFEETTGTDLNWFFDQWYLQRGHPVINVSHYYDPTLKQLRFDIEQVQADQDFYEVFRLPLEVATYYEDGSHEIHKVFVERKEQSFDLPVKAQPVAVVVDPHDVQLMVLNQEVPSSEYLTRLLHVPSVSHRISAFRLMEEIPDDALNQLLQDTFVTIRALALQYLGDHNETEKMYAFAQHEPNLDLRFYVLQKLTEFDPQKARTLAEKLLETTKKNQVIYESLMAIANVDLDAAILHATKYQNNPSPALYVAQAELHARKGSGISLEYFKTERARNVPIDYLEEFIGALAAFLSKQPGTIQQKGLELIRSGYYLNGPIPQYRRFYLITGLMRQFSEESNATFKEEIRQTMKYLYEQEPDDYLREVLREGFGSILEE